MMDASGEIFVDHDTTIIPENLVPHETHRHDDDSNLIPQETHGHNQETHEHEDDSDLVPQQTHGHDDSEIGGGEKKWPGWPGENVFRLIVPSQKVGGIIGRKGEFIKKMCEESRARIKILDGPHGTHQRAVLVSAREEPDSPLPPAMNGLLRVHKRIIDGLEGDPTEAPPGGTASTRLLMPASQAGNLIGKQGATIKSIQDAANCIIRVLGPEELPIFALQDDRVVEIVGEPAAVHKALELAATHLRKFLVDRSVIGIFEMQMQNPHPHMESPMDYNMPPHQSWEPPHQSWEPPHQSWGPPQGPSQGFTPNLGGGPGFGPNPQYNMMPPRQHDNYYPPADIPPIEKPPHQGLSMYGRDASMGPHSAPNAQQQQAVVTQVTQHMQVPLSFADAVIGDAGANISYIRRASGATITIQETRGVPGEMTVEINGTASEVQTAQQLIQNFMAEAAGSQQNNQANAPQDNSYPPHSSVYSSPPSNTGHAPQAAGGYPSGYGNNYGGNTYGY